MNSTEDHITLPVSALKSEATRVFDALSNGRTVYVSRYGDVVAAFRPDVPMEVAAAYVQPQVTTAELTAREMQQAAPTKAVRDAAKGLPSLVTLGHKVYGMLVAAELPAAAAEVPDLDAAEARSEAMNTFLTAHPNASIEDIVEYRGELDERTAATSPAEVAQVAPVPPVALDDDQIDEIHVQWMQRGSTVENTVEGLLSKRPDSAPRYRRHKVKPGKVPARVPLSSSATLREVAGLLDTNPVGARTMYVNALTAEPADRGVMWLLGDLARTEGYVPEATKWYELALGLRPEPTKKSATKLSAAKAAAKKQSNSKERAAAQTAAKGAAKKHPGSTARAATKDAAEKFSDQPKARAAAKTGRKEEPQAKSMTKHRVRDLGR